MPPQQFSTQAKTWRLFIDEILISASGGNLIDGTDFPALIGNGITFVGSSVPDLDSSINTAQDLSQISAMIQLIGTQFRVNPPTIPMPKTIKLVTDGYNCPQPTTRKDSMHACCKKDPKFKATLRKTKFFPRQKGDLTISYDVNQVYENNYMVEVTMENNHLLGRLDHWNLTWEWTRGEFIYSMKGAFTCVIEYSDCIYGAAGQYYKDMDFSKVVNCQKNPIVSDLPPEKANDTEIGKIPHCCKNGTILPIHMDPSKSKSVFQMQVFKVPPDLNKTAIYPPEKWKIMGILNPDYKICNITKPTKRSTRCCVSFSAYYNESVVPCNPCACGCDDNTRRCNPNSQAMLLPPEALLIPFENRTKKTVDWAKLKHFNVPTKLPCADNCGVSINWHVVWDFKGGWSARITLFNWQHTNFENWFTALQFKKKASLGFEIVYSFNGTFLPTLNHTIFLQGIQGSNFLIGLDNGTNPKVPGKSQSVVSFTKKFTPGIKIAKGDGFPSRVFFTGEECSIPTGFPARNRNQHNVDLVNLLLALVLAFTMSKILY
ncbi:hypothetical protein JHK85_002790 [Glycine max]|uniref:COBRA-like protein 11 n=1 Tax=Glycine soja TaxID=3848 RepID=A0A0B2RDK8_GLYSO|nr:hypothetical protein JHK87_002720 [Glycine soja]KAG5070413.1 hypothetical protein JHK85_002790 [Glycine max]KHN30454.1 COBRA-like protein 11 [Glycine soja]